MNKKEYINDEQEYDSYRDGYIKGYHKAEKYYLDRINIDKQTILKLGKQSAVNDIVEILYKENLLNGKIMTEIMKYCHNDEDIGE